MNNDEDNKQLNSDSSNSIITNEQLINFARSNEQLNGSAKSNDSAGSNEQSNDSAILKAILNSPVSKLANSYKTAYDMVKPNDSLTKYIEMNSRLLNPAAYGVSSTASDILNDGIYSTASDILNDGVYSTASDILNDGIYNPAISSPLNSNISGLYIPDILKSIINYKSHFEKYILSSYNNLGPTMPTQIIHDLNEIVSINENINSLYNTIDIFSKPDIQNLIKTSEFFNPAIEKFEKDLQLFSDFLSEEYEIDSDESIDITEENESKLQDTVTMCIDTIDNLNININIDIDKKENKFSWIINAMYIINLTCTFMSNLLGINIPDMANTLIDKIKQIKS